MNRVAYHITGESVGDSVVGEGGDNELFYKTEFDYSDYSTFEAAMLLGKDEISCGISNPQGSVSNTRLVLPLCGVVCFLFVLMVSVAYGWHRFKKKQQERRNCRQMERKRRKSRRRARKMEKNKNV